MDKCFCAPGKEARFQDGRGSQTAGKRKLPAGGRGAGSQPRRGLADKTKVVKLTVDMRLVDKGFGFGKVQTGVVLFTHTSVVQSGRRS